MSALRKANVFPMRPPQVKEDGFIKLDLRQTDENELGSGFAHQYGWTLEARICVEFFANKAQLEDATKAAAKLFAAKLFEDIHIPLAAARVAILGRDAKAAMEAIEQIDKIITGEDS